MKFQTLLLSAPLTLALSPLDHTYDYIIIGSGASGIPLAARLSSTKASVLLIERGFASSGRWGGTWKPSWLQGTNLTRFDVPGLWNYVWQPDFDNRGIFCDGGQPSPAGCLLGGGTAINAGQWYLPRNEDFDTNQPPGFRSADMVSALKRTTERIKWTDTPSTDGVSYLTNGTRIALDALTNVNAPGRFKFLVANENADRDHTASWTETFFEGGERAGPMATYLLDASRRKNFELRMNTTVTRVLRNGKMATGVEVESSGPGGLTGRINVTPGTGRVIVSAGVFNTFKILMRSGIGPVKEIEALTNHSSKGVQLPPKKDWIDLPVGRNLDDGPNFSFGLHVPGIEFYPWDKLWNSTVDNPDIKRYLQNRTGPLAQLQPSIGPVSWDTVTGKDGRKRVIQWDCNTGRDARLPADGGYILFTSNLNLGHTSRGQLSLDPSNLAVTISKSPYFNDEGDHDFAAVVTASTSLLSLLNATILQSYPGSFVVFPPPNQSVEEYLRTQPRASSNHWTGSAKMVKKCGEDGAVVDTSTRICGMKNLHVVDASIFNGLPTANPQATFVVMAERAAEVILGLDGKRLS